jgi:hypothetical protein
MDTRLKKKIMRRIYTAYAMRLALGARTRHVALMVLAGIGLLKLVSVVDVLRNFSSVTVGHAGDFIVSAFVNADAATLLVLAVFAYALFAFVRSGKWDIEGPRFA